MDGSVYGVRNEWKSHGADAPPSEIPNVEHTLYTSYQLLSAADQKALTKERALENLSAPEAGWLSGGKVENGAPLRVKNTLYFPHWGKDGLSKGHPWTMASLQGRKSTFWVLSACVSLPCY